MNFGEFKDRIRNLGFEEEGVFDDNPSHIIQAVNRANILLHNFEPSEAYSDYDVPETEKNYAEIDMSELADFLSKSNKPPQIGNDTINDYYYLADSLFVKASEYSGKKITIIYNRAINMVQGDNDDIDCRTELIPFLELLTAYYIWLDDDERKAVMYYNQFMELYQQYLSMAAGGKGGSGSGGKFTADSQPKASIIGGIDIDNY